MMTLFLFSLKQAVELKVSRFTDVNALHGFRFEILNLIQGFYSYPFQNNLHRHSNIQWSATFHFHHTSSDICPYPSLIVFCHICLVRLMLCHAWRFTEPSVESLKTRTSDLSIFCSSEQKASAFTASSVRRCTREMRLLSRIWKLSTVGKVQRNYTDFERMLWR